MRNFILDSDWYTDCDDAVAVRLLCNAHLQKKINLLGVILNARMPYSLRSVDAFLRYSGVTVPVAVDTMAPEKNLSRTYQKRMVEELYSPYKSNEETENPVALYRRLLASVDQAEMLSIGFPQVITALLQSAPDRYSPLYGMELVKQKVSRLWIMAGKWDKPGEKEYNFSFTSYIAANASELCRTFPKPVTFLGFEVGNTVITGGNLPEMDSLKKALNDHGSPNGRSSWDPMLADLAVSGTPESAGYKAVRGHAEVEPVTGKNYFHEDPAGLHEYVIKIQPDSWYAERISKQIALYCNPSKIFSESGHVVSDGI